MIPAEVCAAYALPEDAAREGGNSVRRIPSLINLTFVVQRKGAAAPEQIVVQRLHPVFGEKVHLDIEAVTAHLAERGLVTPRLIRTCDGRLWVNEVPPATRVWRALSYVEGQTLQKSRDGGQLGSAARLLARFHGALVDLDYEFVHTRQLHDTPRHLAALHSALDLEQARHDSEARTLGEEILRQSEGIRLDYDELPKRIIHGDPKLSNVMFDAQGAQALCMIDLDTLGRGHLAYELGDALRSWCNPAGEDTVAPRVELAAFQSVMAGYGELLPPGTTRDEVLSAVDGLETVSLELASRFAADAIVDAYFGWDPTRFASRRDHNVIRARGQLALSRSVRDMKTELRRVAVAMLSGAP